MKIITFVKGKIPLEKTKEFEDEYLKLIKQEKFPEGLIKSNLLKNKNEEGVYKIETIWKSFEAIEEMRSQEKPASIVLFEKFGVSPSVEMYEISESTE